MGHRPYARDPNAPPSVTQILNLMSKPGLSWGAARETATYAVLHRDSWNTLTDVDAVSKLYRHHRGVWDHRALIGTALHTINAEWCAGNSVRVADLVSSMRAQSPLWQRKPEAEIYAELLPMSDGLSRFWLHNRPESLSYEQVVRYAGGDPEDAYIGTTDWRASIGGRSYILDLKTTGGTDYGKRKYWDTWRLQLAAYRFTTEAVIYDDEDVERGTFEIPEVDAAAVIHLYGDGRWQFEPLRAEKEEHAAFLALRRLYGWRASGGADRGNPGIGWTQVVPL